MNQSDVKQLVEETAARVGTAYWDAPGDVQVNLMNLQNSLNEVLTRLNQDDLASRTEEFDAAASTMKESVMPNIEKLDKSIEVLVKVEDSVKQAMASAMKLSSTLTFFKIPLPI